MLSGMNQEKDYKKMLVLQQQESLQAKKLDEISTFVGAATIPLVMSTPKLYQPLHKIFSPVFTKKNAVIFGSLAGIFGSACVIKLLWQSYQLYKQAQIIINNPVQPSLSQAMHKLVEAIQEKSGRTDLSNDAFHEILKKELEFEPIYEIVEDEQEGIFELSKDKLDKHLKTINDYQTKYFDIISEHVASLLPPKQIAEEIESNNLEQIIENNNEIIDQHSEIRKNNKDLKNIATTFLKDIFDPYLLKKSGFISKDKQIHAKSIEQLVSFIITELKPYEALEYPTQGLLKALKFDQLDKLTQNEKVCQRYAHVLLYLNIQNHLYIIENYLKNSFPKQSHDIVIDLCQRFLKDAYDVTLKSTTKELKDSFNALENTNFSQFDDNIRHLLMLVMRDNQQKLFTIPEQLHPIKNDNALYRYCFAKKPRARNEDSLLPYHYFDESYKSLYETDLLFARYFDVYRSLQEFVYLYDLCHKYEYQLDAITKDEKKFYEETVKDKKRTVVQRLITEIELARKRFIDCTKSILPLIKQDAPRDVTKTLTDCCTIIGKKIFKEI